MALSLKINFPQKIGQGEYSRCRICCLLVRTPSMMLSLCKRGISRGVLFPSLLLIIVCASSVQGRGNAKKDMDLCCDGGKGGKTQAMEIRSGVQGKGTSAAEVPARWNFRLPVWLSRRQAEVKGVLGEEGKRVGMPAAAAPAGGGSDGDLKTSILRPSTSDRLKGMLSGAAKDRGFDLASWLSRGGHLDAASGPLLDTPLIVACLTGCIEAAKALIEVISRLGNIDPARHGGSRLGLSRAQGQAPLTNTRPPPFPPSPPPLPPHTLP